MWRAACRVSPRLLVRCSATAAPQTTSQEVRPYSEVPGPKPVPLLGNAWRFMPLIGTFEPNDFMKWTDDMRASYGDIVKISHVPGRRDMLFLFDPRDIETVFRNEGQWPERFTLDSISHFRTKVRPDFFEGHQGIVNENGRNWQTARTVVNPPMMQPKVARQYVTKMDHVATDFVNRIAGLRDENQEIPADFSNEIHKWALESIALVALDTRLGCLEKDISRDSDPQKMIDAVRAIFDGTFKLDLKIPFWKMFPSPALRKFIKHSEIFLQVCLQHVERSRSSMSEATVEGEMSVLQKILRRDPSTKRAVIMAMDMMLAGVDTISQTCSTVLYYLSRNPERQQRLFEELSLLMPTSPDETLTADLLENMKYLRACIKEAVRMMPPVIGNSRILHKDIVLSNYLIPGNVEFLMANSTLCRMEQHYPSAGEFIPERWLRGEGQDKKAHPFVYLPFGHGPRQCVGMRFANLELETLVARMVHRFRLEWHHADMKFVTKLITIPASPLRFRVIDRNFTTT